MASQTLDFQGLVAFPWSRTSFYSYFVTYSLSLSRPRPRVYPTVYGILADTLHRLRAEQLAFTGQKTGKEEMRRHAAPHEGLVRSLGM